MELAAHLHVSSLSCLLLFEDFAVAVRPRCRPCWLQYDVNLPLISLTLRNLLICTARTSQSVLL